MKEIKHTNQMLCFIFLSKQTGTVYYVDLINLIKISTVASMMYAKWRVNSYRTISNAQFKNIKKTLSS